MIASIFTQRPKTEPPVEIHLVEANFFPEPEYFWVTWLPVKTSKISAIPVYLLFGHVTISTGIWRQLPDFPFWLMRSFLIPDSIPIPWKHVVKYFPYQSFLKRPFWRFSNCQNLQNDKRNIPWRFRFYLTSWGHFLKFCHMLNVKFGILSKTQHFS